MTVAARVAEEVGCQLGQQVGYGIRFEDVSTPVSLPLAEECRTMRLCHHSSRLMRMHMLMNVMHQDAHMLHAHPSAGKNNVIHLPAHGRCI